ncbi:MAG: HEAT repeat domain-containing protein [Candidatus Wallbacteria bacterium]|nr:HEAT repeat domain-containing protein [Candidatus Wallbacteria bacterium]
MTREFELEDSLQQLVYDLDSGLADVRRAAVIWLCQVGDDSSLLHLQRMTTDPDVAVRYFARRGCNDLRRRLGTVPASSDGEPLRLLDSAVPTDRERGALLCYEHRGPELLARLLKVLEVETDLRVRATLVKAVGFSGDPHVVSVLLSFLTDLDSRVRANTVEALQPYDNEDVLERVTFLIHDPDNRVQANVLLFLAQRDPGRVREMVRKMFLSNLVWIQDSALYVLRRLRADWSLELLDELLPTGALAALEPKLRQTRAFLTDGKNGDARSCHTPPETPESTGNAAESAPVELPPSPAEPVSARAQRVTPLTDGLEAFLDLNQWARSMSAEDYRVRLHAVQNTFLFPAGRVVPVLERRAAEESHPFVQASLVRALGENGGAEQVAIILPFLSSPDDRVRANAVEGLEMSGATDVSDAVRLLLDDPSARVRANAARLLQNHDHERSWQALKQMVCSGDQGAIRSALHVMEELDAFEVLELFGLALQSGSQDVQLNVLRVLETAAKSSSLARDLLSQFREGGFAGAGEAELEGLLERVNDPDPTARLEALRRLVRIDDERAWDQISLSARDRDRGVREEAGRLLSTRLVTDERRQALASLGLTVYKSLQQDSGALPGAEKLLAELAGIDRKLDSGFPMNVAMVLRTQRMVSLAELALDLHGKGGLSAHKLAEAIGDFRVKESLLASPAASEMAGIKVAAERPNSSTTDPSKDEGPSAANRGWSGPPVSGSRPGAGLGGRPTPAAQASSRGRGRTNTVMNGETAGGRFSSVIVNYWRLLLPVAISFMALGFVGYRVALHEALSPRVRAAATAAGPPPSQDLLGRIASASNATRFLGLGVRWHGEVAEVSSDRRTLTMKSGPHSYRVKYPSPLAQAPPVGATIQVTGTVGGREDGKVLLAGNRPPQFEAP